MATWEDLVAIATALPEVDESTSYGTPALKVAGKLIARHRTESDGGVALSCPSDEKAARLADPHGVFYTTPHYDGHDYICLWLEKIDLAELEECVVEAWWHRAPARLRDETSP